MKTRTSFTKAALVLMCLSIVTCQPTGDQTATVIIMGRSGTGVSTSVAQFLGPDNSIADPTGIATMVKEFTIPVPTGSRKSFLKIVDVEGLVDGKSLMHDANVLSSLKSYINDPSNLNGEPPNFFIVVSNFDDSNFRGSSSQFIQLVKRVELLQTTLYNRTLDNTMFFMTKLLSESRENQKFPEGKLEQIRQSVRDYSSFEDPIEMVVGENYGKKLPSGYIKLSNKQEYPKNAFDTLIKIAEREPRDNVGAEIVRAWRDSRTTTGIKISSKYQPYSPQVQDEAEFLRLMGDFKYQINNVINKIVTFFDEIRFNLGY